MGLFKKNLVIGMVHLKPLIGTPDYKDNNKEIIKWAINDAKTLEKAGVDAIMIENMGDNPLGEKLNFEQAIFLSAVSALIKKAVKIPIGLDAAFNDYKTGLAICKALDLDFVRLPVYVDTVIYHGGILYPVAVEATRYRKLLGAEKVKILADIQVKYTYMLSKDISLIDSAKMAQSSGADAVIVTGVSTGQQTPIEALEQVKKNVKIPVLIGSGVSVNNVKEQFAIADGAIIGSAFKEGKDISKPISYELTKEFMDKVKEIK
ncbi:MAG: putative sgc region protein SgcQ [Tenericutes bacterium ADurb.Bin239]|nr:MAG: putative sgc region protein SgcQ [Tenericutes bacterium ADurb.Bin239]